MPQGKLEYSCGFSPSGCLGGFFIGIYKGDINMPGIQIVRGDGATVMPRGDVAQGMVFAVKNRDGGLGKVKYAAIGANGRLYSINLTNGELASSANRDSTTTILGKWKFDVTKCRRAQRDCTRREVRPGEVFVVKGGEKEYAHMGRVHRDRQGWLSIPLANQENHAIGEKGTGNVT